MAEVEKNGFELVWKIRHLLIHPGIDREASWCTFKVRTLGDTEWTISIRNKRLKLMATLLMKSSGASTVTLKCNAFLLFVGESALPFSEENSVDHVFSTDSRHGTPTLELKIHEDCSILFQKRSEVFYSDSLTICCQLIPRILDLPVPMVYFAVSNSNRIYKRFLMVVNNFSSLGQDSVYKIANVGIFTIELSITLCKDLSVVVVLGNSSGNSLISLENVFLMDVKTMATSVWNNTVNRSKSFVIPSSILSSKLKDKKRFLPNDQLTLIFEISVTSLEDPATLEGLALGMTSAQNQDYIADFFSKCMEIIQSRSSEVAIRNNIHNSLNNDLQRLLLEGTLTDFELRFPATTIHAHKALLCARSSVFKAMLFTDMKESAGNWVVIEDLDAATIQNLLNFMYTDSMPILDWDSTMKLYAAADKYNVSELKQGCVKFFSSNLSVENVCSVLCLADKHSDKDLKRVIHNFILKHDESVMKSHEWNLLSMEDPKLVLETMIMLYQRSRTPS